MEQPGSTLSRVVKTVNLCPSTNKIEGLSLPAPKPLPFYAQLVRNNIGITRNRPCEDPERERNELLG
jgi:hypothetical protein